MSDPTTLTSGLVLALDAADSRGTVAVFRDGRCVANHAVAMRDSMHERLMPAVSNALRDARAEAAQLSAVICGAGPGSFTSLRIAAGIAKGICFSAGLGLYSVPSLALLAAAAPAGSGEALTPVLDAMRDEWYVANCRRTPSGEVSACEYLGVRSATALVEIAGRASSTVVGNEPDVAGRVRPRARHALDCLAVIKGPEPLEGWEPAYGRLAEVQVRWEAAHGRPLAP
ncbi:MAG: tRNA (adenosine(37)-N6)-threonylcarbamoyltransferase complex dimerization subunit type 1 TsaB [Gemmatimonadetes bacterium]|nr:tRNA (adenosine(37)-N6)-threonylcarbamoyltransferase complex dimerization subunit type 1 TsaB [Gemmatimonadota bacterium]